MHHPAADTPMGQLSCHAADLDNGLTCCRQSTVTWLFVGLPAVSSWLPWFGELFTSIAVVRLCHLFLFYYVSRYISVVSLMQPGVLSSLDFGHAFTKLEIIALFLAAVIPDFISIYHICLPRVPFELALLPNLWSNTPKLGRNVQACIFDMLLTSSKFLKGGSDKCQ